MGIDIGKMQTSIPKRVYDDFSQKVPFLYHATNVNNAIGMDQKGRILPMNRMGAMLSIYTVDDSRNLFGQRQGDLNCAFLLEYKKGE